MASGIELVEIIGGEVGSQAGEPHRVADLASLGGGIGRNFGDDERLDLWSTASWSPSQPIAAV